MSVRTYQANDGTTKAQLEVTADEIEFLSPKGEASATSAAEPTQQEGGFTAVETEELPF